MNRTGFDAEKNMDSVFSQSTESELDFDILFDQDDQLIDIVAGFNEAGEPLTGVDFETLHQDSYNDKVSDFNDELETNGDEQGASDPEGTKKSKDNTVATGTKLDSDSEADKFEKDADKEYQKEKIEPKQEGVYNLFGILDEEDDVSKNVDNEKPESDQEEGGKSDDDEVDDTIAEAAIDLMFMEAEKIVPSTENPKDFDKVPGDPPEEDDPIKEECDGEVDSESDDDGVDDTIAEAAIDLMFMEAEAPEVPIQDVNESDSYDGEVDSESDDDEVDDTISEAVIDLMFMEAEIDKDVKKVDKEDDGEEEDDYVKTVDKNKKNAGKLEYEYSDEELIDSLM